MVDLNKKFCYRIKYGGRVFKMTNGLTPPLSVEDPPPWPAYLWDNLYEILWFGCKTPEQKNVYVDGKYVPDPCKYCVHTPQQDDPLFCSKNFIHPEWNCLHCRHVLYPLFGLECPESLAFERRDGA